MAEKVSSLASVIKTAAQTVTGERIQGSDSFNIDRNYANSRITTGVGTSASNNSQRMANMNGTSNITTNPNFYSPFLTATSFQIPNAQEKYIYGLTGGEIMSRRLQLPLTSTQTTLSLDGN